MLILFYAKSQNSDKNTLLGKFSTRNIETINDSQRMHGLNVQWIIKHVSRSVDLGKNLSPLYMVSPCIVVQVIS